MHLKFKPTLIILLLSLTFILGACADSSPSAKNGSPEMAPLSEMPQEVQDAPVVVQQAYQFAAANPDILSHIPCYCGCGAMGHTSNYACYFSGEQADGSLIFDNHALGCSICVDITLDTMRLQEEGKPVEEIRSFVDATYSQYGPSNMP